MTGTCVCCANRVDIPPYMLTSSWNKSSIRPCLGRLPSVLHATILLEIGMNPMTEPVTGFILEAPAGWWKTVRIAKMARSCRSHLRMSEKETTLYKSMRHAMEDHVVVNLVHQKAVCK